jgi:tRNA-Thr(GGU) m(6)t(6)A37 methyltransferase TsaA
LNLKPIGVIHTSYTEPKGTPIQPIGAKDIKGTIELKPEYVDGLQDLDGFSHIILLYLFHRAKPYSLKVLPYLETQERGVFATRYPSRPNPVGLSVVRLEKIEGNVLHVLDVDVLDGTPLLDIKPFIPDVDNRLDARIGWLEEKVQRMERTKSDGRANKE